MFLLDIPFVLLKVWNLKNFLRLLRITFYQTIKECRYLFLTEVSTSPCSDVFFIVLFPQWGSYVSVETSRNAIFSWRPTVHLYVLDSHVFNFINGLNYRVEIWYINKANILGVQRISKIRNVCRSMYISSL